MQITYRRITYPETSLPRTCSGVGTGFSDKDKRKIKESAAHLTKFLRMQHGEEKIGIAAARSWPYADETAFMVGGNTPPTGFGPPKTRPR